MLENAFDYLPIRQLDSPFSVRQPFFKIAAIDSMIFELKSAFARNLAFLELAIIYSVSRFELAFTHFLVVFKCALKELVPLLKFSAPMHLSVPKLAFVNLAIAPSKNAISRFQSFCERPNVRVTIWKGLLPLPIRHPIFPITPIHSPVWSHQSAFSRKQRILDLSSIKRPICKDQNGVFAAGLSFVEVGLQVGPLWKEDWTFAVRLVVQPLALVMQVFLAQKFNRPRLTLVFAIQGQRIFIFKAVLSCSYRSRASLTLLLS